MNFVKIISLRERNEENYLTFRIHTQLRLLMLLYIISLIQYEFYNPYCETTQTPCHIRE